MMKNFHVKIEPPWLYYNHVCHFEINVKQSQNNFILHNLVSFDKKRSFAKVDISQLKLIAPNSDVVCL